MILYESDFCKNRSLACPYYWAHGHLDAVTPAPAAMTPITSAHNYDCKFCICNIFHLPVAAESGKRHLVPQSVTVATSTLRCWIWYFFLPSCSFPTLHALVHISTVPMALRNFVTWVILFDLLFKPTTCFWLAPSITNFPFYFILSVSRGLKIKEENVKSQKDNRNKEKQGEKIPYCIALMA